MRFNLRSLLNPKRWRFSMIFILTASTTILIGVFLSVSVSARLSPAASGGDTTTLNRTSSAYEEGAPNLTTKGFEDHELGDEAFEEAFELTAGSAHAGLGPVFNNASCVSCHIRNGRGMPEPGQLLLRVTDTAGFADLTALSKDNVEKLKNAPPVEGLGNQVQDFSVAGATPEADVEILWKEEAGAYDDGQPYRLRSPQFNVTLPNGETLPDSVAVSPRIPPHVYGLGLLEAIPEQDILALADPEDQDSDGISGRPNRVWNMAQQKLTLGRFGWKANAPNLRQQTAEAYFNDMGITSSMFPAEDGSTEIDDATLDAATAYSQTLAVPARSLMDDPKVQRGEKLFTDASCVACHVAGFKTGEHKYPSMENQEIHPYTDMLLHDMGEGLADNRPDFDANGQEWRTPSLWGVGLAQTVLPYSGYLHDGRARTFEEAILWHGGESEASKQLFAGLSEEDREAMVKFLQSL